MARGSTGRSVARRDGSRGCKARWRLGRFNQARSFGAEGPTPQAAGTGQEPPAARIYGEAAIALHGLGHEGGMPSVPSAPIGPSSRSLGPSTILNGQTYGASRVRVCGRVAAIAVDPADRAHVLVGAADWGARESRDSGATWAPATDDGGGWSGWTSTGLPGSYTDNYFGSKCGGRTQRTQLTATVAYSCVAQVPISRFDSVAACVWGEAGSLSTATITMSTLSNDLHVLVYNHGLLRAA